MNVLPSNKTVTIQDTLTHFLENLYNTDQNTLHTLTKTDNNTSEPKPPVVTTTELNRIIRNIKQNKAPGFDFIDYNLIKRINNSAPQLLLTLLNTCLRLEYFPKSFKIGIVVLFQKPGKDPTNPKNYRPICLLPALGKMLERIIHGRIYNHLNINNYWSNKQYGFKQGISTEHALDNLINTIKEDKTNNF